MNKTELVAAIANETGLTRPAYESERKNYRITVPVCLHMPVFSCHEP